MKHLLALLFLATYSVLASCATNPDAADDSATARPEVRYYMIADT